MSRNAHSAPAARRPGSPLLPRLARVVGIASAVLALLHVAPTRTQAAPPTRAELALDWSFVSAGPGGAIDRIRDVAVDLSGDVLLCGTSFEPGGNVAALLFKLDRDTGTVLWETRFDPTISDEAVRLVVDAEGSSYITGNTTPSPPFPDVLIAKHDADGNFLWARSFDELDNNDEGLDVALSPDDAVVVTGHANGVQGSNFFTAKLTRDGDVLWTRQLDGGEGSQTDDAVAVGVGPDGAVYVTGTSQGPATGRRPDILTAKYSADGELLWTRRHDGTAASHDLPFDLAVDADGSVVVVGVTEGRRSGADPLVLRYASDGTLLWLHDKGGGGDAGDSARAVVLDAEGNAYVTGSTFSGSGGFDVLVQRLDRDGRRNWRLRWDGGERLGDAGQAIALGGNGHVFVAATALREATETDVATLVVDVDRGRLVATSFHDGELGLHDAPLAIAAGPEGGIAIGGWTNFPSEDFLGLRYELIQP